VMVMTVLASIVLHGVSAEPLARLYARAGRASPVRSPAG
jgi:NhaP-type Na+/H+ or K+/H+ antiporter